MTLRRAPQSKEVDVSAQTVPNTEQRTVALAAIRVERGFNPRDRFEQKRLDEQARSIALHGLLQPLVVAADGDGYRLIAGERRYRAAQLAGLERAPVVVRQPDEGSSGLELAIVENVERVELDVVQEAKAYRRLMDERALTRKGVAERLGIAKRRVTDRLEILELPDELHPRLAAGDIPPAAIKPLARLAKLHPSCPQSRSPRWSARSTRTAGRSRSAGATWPPTRSPSWPSLPPPSSRAMSTRPSATTRSSASR
jgi:ParB family chromosome partitioning protein